MKTVKRMLMLTLVLSMTFFIMEIWPTTNITQLVKGINSTVITVDTPSKFHSVFNTSIIKKQAKITLRIKNYSSKLYDANKISQQIMNKNPHLKYIISGVGYSGSTNGKVATLTYTIRYVECSSSVNNVSVFTNTIIDAVKNRKESVRLRITNYSDAYKLQGVYNKMNGVELPYSFSFEDASIVGMPGSKDIAFELKIKYTNNLTEDTTHKEGYNISAVNDIDEILSAAIRNGEEEVIFTTSNASKISFEAFGKAVDSIIKDNTEYRYFNKWNTSYSGIGNNATYKVILSLNFTKDKIVDMERKVNEKITAIVSSLIKPGMDDYDKELVLHDYLVNNSHYDYKNLINNTIPDLSYTAYGVLIDGIGVCEGYSYAMKRLLKAVGIECIVATGNVFGSTSGPHAWNIVKINNSYYQLDPTFDDPIVNGGTKNVLSHSYFNITDSDMEKDHSWDKTKYPSCTSRTYSFKK